MQEEHNARHARRQTRTFLQLLHESLGQPPLHPAVRKVLVGVVHLLGDDDLGRRWATREAIANLLDQYGGQPPSNSSNPASAMVKRAGTLGSSTFGGASLTERRDLTHLVPADIQAAVANAVAVLEQHGPVVTEALRQLDQATTAAWDAVSPVEPTDDEWRLVQRATGIHRGWGAAYRLVSTLKLPGQGPRAD